MPTNADTCSQHQTPMTSPWLVLSAASAPNTPQRPLSNIQKPCSRLSVPNTGKVEPAASAPERILGSLTTLFPTKYLAGITARNILDNSTATNATAPDTHAALKNLGLLVRLAEGHLRQHQLPMAISLATLALRDAATVGVYENVAYRLLWVRGLAWYGCRDGTLALEDLRSAVLHAPPAKRSLAIRCLTKVQHLLDTQQYSVSITMLTNSEDENTSATTQLSGKRPAQWMCEVSSTSKKQCVHG